MQRQVRTILRHGMAAIALWIGSLWMLPYLAPAQQPLPTSQDEKTAKPHKSKKAPADTTASTPAESTKTHKGPAPVKNASDAEIQAAKSTGKVWVNTDSGVYHKGGKWYGATKQGKFMSEQEATKAGYRAAKNEK
jgi:cytoskeletal protein RodZ